MNEKIEIGNFINKCRFLARNGLVDGRKSIIPEIKFIAIPFGTFVGTPNNPAIFVTQRTYKLYSHIPSLVDLNIVEDATILIKEQFIQNNHSIALLGVIAHEMGHAFNVTSNLYPNTEENACIFEIGTLLRLYREGSWFMNIRLSKENLTEYFKSRISNYTKTSSNRILVKLVEYIINPASDFMFSPFMPKTKSSSTLFANTPSPKTKTLFLAETDDSPGSNICKL